MAKIIRRDLNRFFLYWLLALNFLWIATPWLDDFAGIIGPTWLWTLLVPAICLTMVNFRRTLGVLLGICAIPLAATEAICQHRRYRRG